MLIVKFDFVFCTKLRITILICYKLLANATNRLKYLLRHRTLYYTKKRKKKKEKGNSIARMTLHACT